MVPTSVDIIVDAPGFPNIPFVLLDDRDLRFSFKGIPVPDKFETIGKGLFVKFCISLCAL
jgi:hypothetical protein